MGYRLQKYLLIIFYKLVNEMCIKLTHGLIKCFNSSKCCQTPAAYLANVYAYLINKMIKNYVASKKKQNLHIRYVLFTNSVTACS